MITPHGTVFPPVTFGRPARSRTQAGLRILEAVHDPNVKLDLHDHEDPTIVAVDSAKVAF